MQLIAHVDMDCFFVACEVKKDPTLRGKPVVVGSTGNRGVASTASYEARAYGVRSATPIAKARKLCPRAIFLPVNGKLYKQESEAVFAVFAALSDTVVGVSCDEAYLDVSHLLHTFSTLQELGTYIKDSVYAATGLTCSVGLAQTKLVAKVASEWQKPNGVTVITDPPSFLREASVKILPGVGSYSRKKLESGGICTIGDLVDADRCMLLDTFGLHAVWYQQILKGEKTPSLRHRHVRKSVGKERTFGKDQTDISVVREYLQKLCGSIEHKLADYSGRTVSVKIRYNDFSTKLYSRSFSLPTQSIRMISSVVDELFVNNVAARPIRLIGFQLSGLTKVCEKQTNLVDF